VPPIDPAALILEALMAGSLHSWISLLVFTTARRIYTLTQVRRAAAEMGLVEFVAELDEYIAHDEASLQLEGTWNRGRRGRASTARGRAAEIDNSNDRLLSAMHSGAERIRDSVRPTHPVHQVAVDFLHHFFPDGVVPVIRQNFEEQLITMETMLRELRGPFAEHVQKLQLSLFVDELSELVPQFRTELENHPVHDISFDQVRAAREQGQENLRAVVARALGIYYGTSPEHVEGRKRLLGPIREQNDRLAALRRSRRAGSVSPVIDVNPTTGQEYVVPDADVTADVEDALPAEA
jgi:hypothetical protein